MGKRKQKQEPKRLRAKLFLESKCKCSDYDDDDDADEPCADNSFFATTLDGGWPILGKIKLQIYDVGKWRNVVKKQIKIS